MKVDKLAPALTIMIVTLMLFSTTANAAAYLTDPNTPVRSAKYWPFDWPGGPTLDMRCEDMSTSSGLRNITCRNGLGCIETNKRDEYDQNCPFWRSCQGGDKSPYDNCMDGCTNSDPTVCDGQCSGQETRCRYSDRCTGANGSCNSPIECSSSKCDRLRLNSDGTVMTPGTCLPITRCQPDCVPAGEPVYSYTCCLGLKVDAAGICQPEDMPIFPDALFDDIDYFSFRDDKKWPSNGGEKHKIDPYTCGATLHVKQASGWNSDTNLVRRTATSMERSYLGIEWLWGMATMYLNDYFGVNRVAKAAGTMLKTERRKIQDWYGEELEKLTIEGDKLMDKDAGADATGDEAQFNRLIEKFGKEETDTTAATATYRHLAAKNRMLAQRDMRLGGLMSGFIGALDGVNSAITSSNGQLNKWGGSSSGGGSSVFCIILPMLCKKVKNMCGGSGGGSPNKVCTRGCVTTSVGTVVDPLWDGGEVSENGFISRFKAYANQVLKTFPVIGDHKRVTLTTSVLEMRVDLGKSEEEAKKTSYEERRNMALKISGQMAHVWFGMFGKGGCGQVQHSQKQESIRRMKEQALYMERYYKVTGEMRMATAECLDNFANNMAGIFEVVNNKESTPLKRLTLGRVKVDEPTVTTMENTQAVLEAQFECPPNTPGCSGNVPGATKALGSINNRGLQQSSSSTGLGAGEEFNGSDGDGTQGAIKKGKKLGKSGKFKEGDDLGKLASFKDSSGKQGKQKMGNSGKIGSSAAYSSGSGVESSGSGRRARSGSKYEELEEQVAEDDVANERDDIEIHNFNSFKVTPSGFSSQDEDGNSISSSDSDGSNSLASRKGKKKGEGSDDIDPDQEERRRYIALMLKTIANNKHRYAPSQIDGLFWKISKTYIRYAIPRIYSNDLLLQVEEAGTGTSGKSKSNKAKSKK
jgi:hypothetical protein